MPSAGFEPAIPATKGLQTYTFNSMTTGVVVKVILIV